MLYLADVVLSVVSPILTRGAVRVEGSQITAVGSASELTARSGEDVVDLVLPVLIRDRIGQTQSHPASVTPKPGSRRLEDSPWTAIRQWTISPLSAK